MSSEETDGPLPPSKRRVLLRPRTYCRLERMAEKEEAEVAELANRAVREMLKREGYWEDGADAEPGEGDPP